MKLGLRVNFPSSRSLPLTYIYNPKSTSSDTVNIYGSEREVGAMIPHDEPDGTPAMPHGELNLPRVAEPADENDVMREQLEYLIDHASEQGTCGCSECQRYLRARSLLLEIFSEPAGQPVRRPSATMPMAA
jgi:hypothetical protein